MISSWTLYWILKLDALSLLFSFLSVVVFILFLMFAWIWLDPEVKEDGKPSGKFISGVFLFLLLSSGICLFLPTTNQMAMIYVIPKLSNSDFAQKMPGKLEKLMEKGVDKLIDNIDKKEDSKDD